MLTYRAALAEQCKRLSEASPTPQLDAEILLAFVLSKPRTVFISRGNDNLTESAHQQFIQLVNRRLECEPIAYILGEQEFWSMPLKVTPAVLIPRPDTECLVEYCLTKIPPDTEYLVADLGTGSGAIALAVGKERPKTKLIAIDKSSAALDIAKYNARQNRVDNITFATSDWLSEINITAFDLIISNPPYISSDDPHLKGIGVRYEPKTALVSDNNGMADIETIASQSYSRLKKSGLLAIEHGYQQGILVRETFQRHGFSNIATHQDYSGNDRFTVGVRS